jgi:hypothetical protein
VNGFGPGKKYDAGKVRLDLVPMRVVREIAKVLSFGAEKYGANNWQNVEPFEGRYYAALQRHLTSWREGERADPETGLPHLAHAGCCLFFLLSRELGFEPALDVKPAIEVAATTQRSATAALAATPVSTSPPEARRVPAYLDELDL